MHHANPGWPGIMPACIPALPQPYPQMGVKAHAGFYCLLTLVIDITCSRKILVMKYIVVLFFIILMMSPMLSSACAFCQGGANKENIAGYEGITLFLALMPIISVGSIFYWIYAKSKKL